MRVACHVDPGCRLTAAALRAVSAAPRTDGKFARAAGSPPAPSAGPAGNVGRGGGADRGISLIVEAA